MDAVIVLLMTYIFYLFYLLAVEIRVFTKKRSLISKKHSLVEICNCCLDIFLAIVSLVCLALLRAKFLSNILDSRLLAGASLAFMLFSIIPDLVFGRSEE